MTQLFPSRDRQKLRKNRPHAAKAGETACPTIGNTGLAVVAQALSPAAFDFFSAPQKVRKNRSRAVLAGQTACPTIGNAGLAVVAQALSPAAFDFFSAPDGRGSEVVAEPRA